MYLKFSTTLLEMHREAQKGATCLTSFCFWVLRFGFCTVRLRQVLNKCYLGKQPQLLHLILCASCEF